VELDRYEQGGRDGGRDGSRDVREEVGLYITTWQMEAYKAWYGMIYYGRKVGIV
jgi:hypothetical protein